MKSRLINGMSKLKEIDAYEKACFKCLISKPNISEQDLEDIVYAIDMDICLSNVTTYELISKIKKYEKYVRYKTL